VSDPDGNVGGVWCESINALLSDCVIVSNTAAGAAGGAYSGTLTNCAVISNTQLISGDSGSGGVFLSRLENCLLTQNSSAAQEAVLNNCLVISNSDGVSSSILNNCTVVGNTGSVGVWGSTANNCILFYNAGVNFWSSTLNYCCSSPLPLGPGNITDAPLFVDLTAGNLRLGSNSPCINAGRNSYVAGGADLDGNARIVGGTVDIGAYEFQTPTSVISYAWLQQYGLPTDGSADYTDPDGDGMNNWQEWIAGTDPTNVLSALRMLNPSDSLSGLVVPWESVSGIFYYLQRSTNFSAQPEFSFIQAT